MSRHPSGHRVNAVPHLGAVAAQQFPELADGVLGLGGGHAVAGNEDHVARRLQNEIGVGSRDGIGLSLVAGRLG